MPLAMLPMLPCSHVLPVGTSHSIRTCEHGNIGSMARGIAWNTGQLLCAATGDATIDRTPVEYHLRSWRELYDKSILSADRHHSSAGEWAVHGDGHFYTVSVTS